MRYALGDEVCAHAPSHASTPRTRCPLSRTLRTDLSYVYEHQNRTTLPQSHTAIVTAAPSCIAIVRYSVYNGISKSVMVAGPHVAWDVLETVHLFLSACVPGVLCPVCLCACALPTRRCLHHDHHSVFRLHLFHNVSMSVVTSEQTCRQADMQAGRSGHPGIRNIAE